MLAKYVTPAALLLASAVNGQQTTPSVVTFISITPSPTTEQIFSIQPVFSSGRSSVEGSMGIPIGETPITIIDPGSISPSIFTNPIRTTPVPTIPASPSVSTPGGSQPGSGSVSGSAAQTSSQASRSGTASAPPQQSTAAASSLNSVSNGQSMALAMVASGMTLVGAAFVLL